MKDEGLEVDFHLEQERIEEDEAVDSYFERDLEEQAEQYGNY